MESRCRHRVDEAVVARRGAQAGRRRRGRRRCSRPRRRDTRRRVREAERVAGTRNRKKEKGREEEESGRGKNVISPLFSLFNRLQPVRGVLWPNFTEPECLMAKCSKVGVHQQMTITLDVQQTIIPFYYLY